MRQPLAQSRSEDISRLEIKKERRLKAEKLVSRSPASAIVQNFAREEQVVVPSVASPEAEEKDLQQLARAPSFADRLQDGNVLSSSSARELYYANKSQRVDMVGEEFDGTRAQQRLGGLTSKTKKALPKDVSDLKKSQEIVQDDSQGQTRGIRYRFVRRAADGKDEAIDITQLSGKWSDLHLAIESNVSGYLYVLTSYGPGKWQWMRPEFLNAPRSPDGAIQVKGYESVNFALSQVTNAIGKPVVSAITVLLSSNPLTDLGKWLGQGVGSGLSEDDLTKNATTEKFVIDPSLKPGTPLRVNIALEEE